MRITVDALLGGQEPPVPITIGNEAGIIVRNGENVIITFQAKQLVKAVLELVASGRDGDWAKKLQGTW